MEGRVASDQDLKLGDTLRYYQRDSNAAKALLIRRLRCLAAYEAANRNLEKARAKNKDVHAVSLVMQDIDFYSQFPNNNLRCDFLFPIPDSDTVLFVLLPLTDNIKNKPIKFCLIHARSHWRFKRYRQCDSFGKIAWQFMFFLIS